MSARVSFIVSALLLPSALGCWAKDNQGRCEFYFSPYPELTNTLLEEGYMTRKPGHNPVVSCVKRNSFDEEPTLVNCESKSIYQDGIVAACKAEWNRDANTITQGCHHGSEEQLKYACRKDKCRATQFEDATGPKACCCWGKDCNNNYF